MTTAASSPGALPGAVAWDGGDLVITRTFAAPREAVFRAWTEAGHFARWWGPHGATLPFCRIDARPGGVLHYRHHFTGGDHEDVWIRGTFGEVAAPERISFTTHFSDAEGNRVDRPGFPLEMTITVTFAEEGGGTRVTARHAGLVEDQGEVQGWLESLDRLAALLINPHTQAGE
ncbi:MAG TPA: SRPBCC domain-containing protein [Longimicrobium sp.]|nr:SRPBCC domain-containing protein [Longimicrobium sp.]